MRPQTYRTHVDEEGIRKWEKQGGGTVTYAIDTMNEIDN